jgi:hypothetical protein
MTQKQAEREFKRIGYDLSSAQCSIAKLYEATDRFDRKSLASLESAFRLLVKGRDSASKAWLGMKRDMSKPIVKPEHQA